MKGLNVIKFKKMADTSKSRITSLSVNQTQEFFAVATEHGFEVHKIDPLSDKQTKTSKIP